MAGVRLHAKVGRGDVNYLARWDGAAWSAVSTGIAWRRARVAALAVSGSDLYVGGDFDQIGGLVVNGIARWEAAATPSAAVRRERRRGCWMG